MAPKHHHMPLSGGDRKALSDYFRGKPNTKAVLEEKANVVVQMVISNFDTVPFFANAFVRVGDKEARQSQAETAALLLSLTDRPAFAILGSEDRDVFMGAAEAGVIGALQDKGIAERAAFLDLLRKRYEEYSHEDINGMFRAFGKNVATILCVGPNILFDMNITNALLTSFHRWGLDELLRV